MVEVSLRRRVFLGDVETFCVYRFAGEGGTTNIKEIKNKTPQNAFRPTVKRVGNTPTRPFRIPRSVLYVLLFSVFLFSYDIFYPSRDGQPLILIRRRRFQRRRCESGPLAASVLFVGTVRNIIGVVGRFFHFLSTPVDVLLMDTNTAINRYTNTTVCVRLLDA